jgi:zinc protease
LYLDRNCEFIKEREKAIEALTIADIQEAFKKYIDPAKLVIIRAGDFKK